MTQKMLIENGFIDSSVKTENKTFSDLKIVEKNHIEVNTVLSNMAYYGYTLDAIGLINLYSMNSRELNSFWKKTEDALKQITGSDKKIADYVVYKNFPKEVLDMSQADYWFNQIMMYIGIPKENFAQVKDTREPLNEKLNLKVLKGYDEYTLLFIKTNLIKQKVSWSSNQKSHMFEIIDLQQDRNFVVDFSIFGFKKNAVDLATYVFKSLGKDVSPNNFYIPSATDVLRLCASLSESDVSLKKVVFSKELSKRKNRKLILDLLDKSFNLLDDVALRPKVFKMLFQHLHPGDYNFENVKNAYDLLYKDKVFNFAQKLNANKQNKELYFDLLKSRPGEFLRNFHNAYSIYPKDAIQEFTVVMNALSNFQLLNFEKYINTINDRKTLLVKPNAKWTKAKVLENKKVKIDGKDLDYLNEKIHELVSYRLNQMFPEGVDLDEKTKFIKIPSNDQKVAPYGRGTKFFIPEESNFIRTSTYWKHNKTMFMDNGWNFFNKDFNKAQTLCWNSTESNFSAFSGDPINSSNKDFAGCQLIDIDLKKMEESEFKYGVWNVLSFNQIQFKDCDSHATLQYGKGAMTGELFEPARVNMSFQLLGDELTKFVTLFDIKERSMIYMDFSLGNNTKSAQSNEKKLMEIMPAVLDYFNAIPSVYDLFKHAKKGLIKVLYEDSCVEIKDEKAYVFLPKNKANLYEKISLESILELQDVSKKIKNKI